MSTKRHVHIDARLCEAHALCVELVPDVFVLDDDVAACHGMPRPDRRPEVEAAIAACPRQAISWLEH